MDVQFISILGHQNICQYGSKHTVYYLHVTQNNTCYVIPHRYNDFEELCERMSKKEGYKVPALPPKRFIGSLNPDFLVKRQQNLLSFLQTVTATSVSTDERTSFRHSIALKEFLLYNKELLESADKWKAVTTKQIEEECLSTTDSSTPNTPDEAANCESRTDENEEQEVGTSLYGTPKVSLTDFELMKVIGKGSYGKVVLVKKIDSGKLFAMKSLGKLNIKRRHQVEHTKTERSVLGKVKHPFIVHLYYAFQTPQKLYFVLDYCAGGELFFHISRMEKIPEHMARFYAAEITLALGHLHDLDVVYRDLKPENILFDAKGHILLADFGLAKEGITGGDSGTNSMCGTPEYLPPEILDRKGHGTAVDWWALGMVLYEMLTGLPPWYTRNRQKLFESVRSAALTFPDYVTPSAQSLIRGLLDRNVMTRLGSKSTEDVKNHPFFSTIDWIELYDRKTMPPFNPCQHGDIEETHNFEAEFTNMMINSVGDTIYRTSSPGSINFEGFTYNTPNLLGTPLQEEALVGTPKKKL